MSTTEIALLAVGLCMDSFALAISSGMVHRAHLIRHAFRLGICFALFQGVMPLLGWLAGVQLKAVIEGMDHWIAFGLLGVIGVKMIVDALRQKPEECMQKDCSLKLLCGMALATSIDALAVGVTLAFVQTAILPAAAIIGAMTFVFSFIGVLLGRKIGSLFEEIVMIAGGTILIAIGFKILLEHLL